MNFLISFRSEFLKTKRTASWYLVFSLAFLVSAIFVLTVTGNKPTAGINLWTAVFTEEFKSLNLLVLPMFTILICTLLPQIEYRNTTWKQVMTSPQHRVGVYLSKFLLLQVLLVLFLLLFLTGSGFYTMLIGMGHPTMKLFNSSLQWDFLLTNGVRTYLSVLSVSALQFVFGLTMKNFVAPIVSGFILWLTGNLLLFEMHSPLAHFFPYSFSAMVVFPRYDNLFPQILGLSVCWSIVLLFAGYFVFAKIKS
jgi:hypothetical protein